MQCIHELRSELAAAVAVPTHPTPDQRLLRAMAKGDVKAVRALCDGGADAAVATPNGTPGVVLAAFGGHEAVVAEVLGARGAPLSLCRGRGIPAATAAAARGHASVLRLLHTLGDDLTGCQDPGTPPVCTAAAFGFVGCLEVIHELCPAAAAGVGKNSANALFFAVSAGRNEAVAKLVSLGYDVNARLPSGSAPIHFAASHARLATLEKLRNLGADVDLPSATGTALTAAARRDAYLVVSTLLRLGADPRGDGGAAVQACVRCGYTRSLAVFLDEGGVDPDAMRADSVTLLWAAAYAGQAAVVEVLVSRGASVNLPKSTGSTPLAAAALQGHTECLKALVRHGAHLDAKGLFGSTPLHFASQNGHWEAVRWLISAGASVNAKRNDVLSPVYVATIYNKPECIEVLALAGADLTAGTSMPMLAAACQKGHTAAVAALARHGADVNMPLKSKHPTPLHVAAHYGRGDVIRELFRHGADLPEQGLHGAPAASLAVVEKLRTLKHRARVVPLRQRVKAACLLSELGLCDDIGGLVVAALEQNPDTFQGPDLMEVQGAPAWKSNSTTKVCSGCDKRFDYATWRHHCRACGHVFCSACTNKTRVLPFDASRCERVCAPCASVIDAETCVDEGEPSPEEDH
ncbi:hypothetical protein DIPPA_30388 [Diplonema papillatum]|nr:hypothetical protein DIPPA_30388 [Diplonema papillatum]